MDLWEKEGVVPIDLRGETPTTCMKCVYVIFGIVVLAGCVGQGPNLDFSTSGCDESIDTRGNMGVKKVDWLDDTTVVVVVQVNINCAEEIEGGDFYILGNTITLKYISPKCETCAFCLCAHEMVYKFTNLEKKEYQFVLERIT